MSDLKPVLTRGESASEALLHRAEAEAELNPLADVDFGELELSLYRPRTFFSILLSWIVGAMTLFALVPLFAVLWMLIWRGGQKLSVALFTKLPPAPLEQGGGFGNAIVGTLIMVGLATLITVPLGVLTAVYLAQAPSSSKLASAVRFSAKVLTGFPSILAGVFAYGAIVLATGGYSAIAGAIALAHLDAADHHSHLGECDCDGAGEDERSVYRDGCHDDADCLDGSAAYSNARHPYWSDASGSTSRRRNGTASVYGTVQQLLARQPRAA